MAYYADETPWNDGTSQRAGAMLAIGWIEAGHAYQRGPIAAEVVTALAALLVNPWAPAYAGGHPQLFVLPHLRRPEAPEPRWNDHLDGQH